MSVYMAPEYVAAELRANERLAAYFNAPGACAYRATMYDTLTGDVLLVTDYSAQGGAAAVERARDLGCDVVGVTYAVVLRGLVTTLVVTPSGRRLVSLVKPCEQCKAPAVVVLRVALSNSRVCPPCADAVMGAYFNARVLCDPYAGAYGSADMASNYAYLDAS